MSQSNSETSVEAKIIEPQILNPMTFPLHGARLIEASAGTGKTFTIAALYLRLLLGHGDKSASDINSENSNINSRNNAHARPLTVEEILVVTFTDAATAELRTRIRERIHQARLAFLVGESDDEIIQTLINDTQASSSDPIESMTLASRLLLAAERQMDEAAIFTIHGFCQRVLTQYAFDSGRRFQYELVTDESELKQRVIQDFWRRNFYHLPVDLAQIIQSIWRSPADLLKDVSRLLSEKEVSEREVSEIEASEKESSETHQREKDQPFSEDIEQQHQEYLQKIEQVKREWKKAQQEDEDLETLLKASSVSARSYSKANLPKWLKEVDAWAENTNAKVAGAGANIPSSLEKFAQSTLDEKIDAKKAEKKMPSPEHAVFSAIDELLQAKPNYSGHYTYHAIQYGRAELERIKQELALQSFNDMLSHLDQAIQQDSYKPNCHQQDSQGQLVANIRERFPVAMIDEFQDTDPLQYRIFSSIYLDHPECGWFMIGDPKQAIYAFRQADIFTYIRARNEVSAHYTLNTNWRSSTDMVEAVNCLFQFSDGAFIYKDDIPFQPVQHSPNAESMQWQLGDPSKSNIQPSDQPAIQLTTQTAMNLWYYAPEGGETCSKTEYFEHMSARTAYQIHQILTQSQADQAHFIKLGSDKNVNKKAIKAKDIAILVRTGFEAKQVKQALSEQGIDSVYLSNRDSVFASDVAMDCARLLTAVLNPQDERALRALFASDLWGLALNELEQLNQDERRWEAELEAVLSYQKTWFSQGVMPMMRQLLIQRKLSERWLKQIGGERLLTDFLHLAEIFQQESLSLESERSLTRWLLEKIAQSDQTDEQIQRLESERDLVKIVTIHKSKGLEYPLIFVPFIMSMRESKAEGKGKFVQYYDESSQQKVQVFDADKDVIAQADKERIAEDMRLLYVALTRAEYGAFIGIAPLKVGISSKCVTHKSALGRLLQNHKEVEPSELHDLCKTLASESNSIQLIEDMPAEPSGRYMATTPAMETPQAQQFNQQIERFWGISSYSGIIKQHHNKQNHNSSTNHGSQHTSHHAKQIDSTVMQFDDILDMEKPLDIEVAGEKSLSFLQKADQTDTTPIEVDPWSMFAFPRGANPGTFLHTIFEEIEFTDDITSPRNTQILAGLLQRNDYDENWLAPLQKMISQVLNTPLDGKDLRLAQKGPSQRLTEMEFLLPVETLSASNFSHIIQTHDSLSAQAEALDFWPVKGMLKGFIDLVFEHQGRYYVLDWKSNYLGDQVSDYQPEALASAMLDHRYDVQYQLYSLVLHRFLKTRLPDYDYQQHFGGVYYLFLRGFSDALTPDSGVFSTRPSLQMLEQMDQEISRYELRTK